MTGWDKDYLANKEEYLALFDRVMQKKQETNIEFLEKKLSKRLGRNVVACANGTDALYFALLSRGIGPGDEVLVSNFSWISTASVIAMTGATPVFTSIEAISMHMNISSIRKLYGPKTPKEGFKSKVKALIYPHLFGNMSDTTRIKKFCQAKDILFIEDACQALGSSYNGVAAGTIGDISTLSFNDNKVIAGIAGGGAIVTDGDTEIFKKLRQHGKHEMLGYNSKMLLFNAEVINYRLDKLDWYIEKRQAVAKLYDDALKDVVTVQDNPPELNHNYHKYVVRFKDKETRDKVKEKLGATVHYERPLSEYPMWNNIPHRKEDKWISQEVCDTILSLPIHPYMTKEEINKVVNTILILV
jgi:dTDP-4-amino-4,6-dideoxygalactose transaminase